MRFGVFSNAFLALTVRMFAALMILCLPAFVALSHAKPLELRDLALAGDSLKTRMLFKLDRDAEPKLMLLRSPYRLIIDLPEARFAFSEKALKPRGLIAGIQYGPLGNGRSRIVVTAKGPFKIADLDILSEENTGKRLVLDLEAASDKSFDAALVEQSTATSSIASVVAVGSGKKIAQNDAEKFTIVIDPGHGGIDGGANGASGTAEKEITLAFAKELGAQLEATGNFDVHFTRNDDRFLRLDERVRIARQKSADLFISIHADSIRLKGVSGATVYTVSDRASDAESAALAIRENLADKLPGIEIEDEDHQVADILVDLIRRETHTFSMSFAKTLVGELKHTVAMINNPHRMAGFRVLRAPDVPSVLLELGYLSNASDEKHLLDAEWRAKTAKSIVDAVLTFAGPRIGTRG